MIKVTCCLVRANLEGAVCIHTTVGLMKLQEWGQGGPGLAKENQWEPLLRRWRGGEEQDLVREWPDEDCYKWPEYVLVKVQGLAVKKATIMEMGCVGLQIHGIYKGNCNWVLHYNPTIICQCLWR